MANSPSTHKTQFSLARLDNGTIQITFSIPQELVKKQKKEALSKLAKEIEIDGFRKGMAPLDKVEAKVGDHKITETILEALLPQALGEAIKQEKLVLALYPKFELVSAKDDEPWQVRATSCILPKIKTSNLKEVIMGGLKASNIWTPDKGKETPQAPTPAQKEEAILKTIVKEVEIEVPQLLLEEEVNQRLSSLLSRLEKLSLNLDSYLASVGKTPEGLRAEYRTQVIESLKIELVLNQLAQEANLKVQDEEVETALKQLPEGAKVAKNSTQFEAIRNIIKRQNILKQLAQ